MKLEGISVRDASRPRFIEVLPREIASARSKKPDKCAAALACKRAFHTKEVRVYVSRIYIKRNGVWLRYLTPDSLSREIVALDRGGRFEPGTHKLVAPTKGNRLGANRNSETGVNKRPRRVHNRTKDIRISPVSVAR